jgi:hypothetical protein
MNIYWLSVFMTVLGSLVVQAQPTQPPPVAPYIATGGNTAIGRADRDAWRINVRDYGAKCDNTTDDRNAFAAAINRVNTLQIAGTQAILYVPPGICRIKGTNGALPQFATGHNGGVVGDGQMRSWVVMDSTYTGDLFSWSESWINGGGVWPEEPSPASGQVNAPLNKAGPVIRNISLMGDRTASGSQYALHFYDRSDFVLVNNVDMLYIKGGCISTGDTKNSTAADIRESNFHGIRCFNSGDTNIPAIEFRNHGGGGGGPLHVSNVDIWAPYWTGLAIRSDSSFQEAGYYFNSIRIEGFGVPSPSPAADLLQIGDATFTGTVSNQSFQNVMLISPYANQCALRVTSHDISSRSYQISFSQTNILQGGGAGNGLCLDSVRTSEFHIISNTVPGTQLVLGPLVGTDVVIDGGGAEKTWTASVDAAAVKTTHGAAYTTGPFQGGNMSFALTNHDGTATGGNGLNLGGVDLQIIRTSQGQVASGNAASISGGQTNTASGNFSHIGGGASNSVTGIGSTIPGGTAASDLGRRGWLGFADGSFGAFNAQMGNSVLRGTGSAATPFRLTSGAGAASTVNCYNISDGRAFNFSVRLQAHGQGVVKDFAWYLPIAMLTRDIGASTTLLSLGTPVTLSRGTVTGAAVNLTADITNGCLDLEFTPPSGNTDTWDVAATINAVEVQ